MSNFYKEQSVETKVQRNFIGTEFLSILCLDWAMAFLSIKKKLTFLLFLLLFFSFGMSGCTSSDKDDISVLEDGLESIDGEIDSDLFDDEDDEFADEDGEVEDEEDEELAQLDEEFADSEDEDDDDWDDEDDEFADLDEDDEDDDDEFADLDEDDEDDDDEFADLDEDDWDDEDDDDEFADLDEDDEDVAQNEEALGEELKQGEEGSSEFPEAVVGQEGAEGDPANTSETQDITVGQTGEEASLPQDDLGQADPISPDNEDDASVWVPVVKVKTDSFYKNNRLINAVYIVRPQDTMDSISQKIYGDIGKVEELNANNSHLAKGIDPGDKVYYNSPNRPDDKSQLRFFYDDVGLEPQIYITKENDNMRRLGSRLLGFADGWKEIWAINQNVDSKTVLPGGLQFRYWTGSEPTVDVAKGNGGSSDEEDMIVNQETEQEVSKGGDKEFPAEPEEIAFMGTVGDQPAPPPAEPNLPPEPPLPEPQMNMLENDLEPSEVADVEVFPDLETDSPAVSATDPESLVSTGALALLLLAGLVLVVIQIKKRSGATALSPSSLEYTQV